MGAFLISIQLEPLALQVDHPAFTTSVTSGFQFGCPIVECAASRGRRVFSQSQWTRFVKRFYKVFVMWPSYRSARSRWRSLAVGLPVSIGLPLRPKFQGRQEVNNAPPYHFCHGSAALSTSRQLGRWRHKTWWIFGNKRYSGTKIDQESASCCAYLGVWPD